MIDWLISSELKAYEGGKIGGKTYIMSTDTVQ